MPTLTAKKAKPLPTPEEFATLLLRWRHRNGFSQRRAAVKLGFHHITIAYWETGHYRAGEETIRRVAPILREKKPLVSFSH